MEIPKEGGESFYSGFSKLAWTTSSDENSRLDLGPTGCIPCFAGIYNLIP